MTKQQRGISKKPAFLAAFVAARGSVTRAAEAVGIERTLHYRWLEDDEAYKREFELVTLQAAQAIEDEAIRRASEGFEEPVIYQGQLCYAEDQYVKNPKTKKPTLKKNAKPLTVRKHSDALLLKLLDGWLPDKYRRRSNVQLTGADGGPIRLEAKQLETLSDDELATLAELAKKLKPETGA